MTAILVLTVTLVINGHRVVTTMDFDQPNLTECQTHGEMLVATNSTDESYRFRCELRS